MQSFFNNLLLISALAIFPGCSLFGINSSIDLPVTLQVSTAKNLNPDEQGRASPIVIRIYQLSQINTFNNSDFFTLYENDQTLLAKDLIYREELEIRPDQSQDKIIELNVQTKYVAVLAAYRHLDKAQWKTFISINPKNIEQLSIELKKSEIKLSSSD